MHSHANSQKPHLTWVPHYHPNALSTLLPETPIKVNRPSMNVMNIRSPMWKILVGKHDPRHQPICYLTLHWCSSWSALSFSSLVIDTSAHTTSSLVSHGPRFCHWSPRLKWKHSDSRRHGADLIPLPKLPVAFELAKLLFQRVPLLLPRWTSGKQPWPQFTTQATGDVSSGDPPP